IQGGASRLSLLISQHSPHPKPVAQARAHDRARETDREIVEAGDAAARNRESEPDCDGWNQESDQRKEITNLHGRIDTPLELGDSWRCAHSVVSLRTRIQVVVRPTRGIPTYPRRYRRSLPSSPNRHR